MCELSSSVALRVHTLQMRMAAASDSSAVGGVEHAECSCVLLVAPWTEKCDNFIAGRVGMPQLLNLASEHGEVHIEESGTSRSAYVVKVFLYSKLPPPELRSRFNKSLPMRLEGSREYAIHFIIDRPELFKGVLESPTVQLSDISAEKAPLLEEIRLLIAFVSSTSAERQKRRCSVAALVCVGNKFPSQSVTSKRTVVEEGRSCMGKRVRELNLSGL
jgi:hypothetical protein